MIVLAADIGGTRIKLGLVRDGRVLAHAVLPSHSHGLLANRLPDLAAAFRKLCAANEVNPSACGGISMSAPTIVDEKAGRARSEYGLFRDMPDLDLRAWAQEEFGLPLALENDARMATIGEWRHGAGRGCDNLVMITLGTGLGTSAVIEGHILRGAHGQAGCLGGHLTLRYGGRTCGCGNLGCAETEASTKFLTELARARPDYPGSALSREPLLDFAATFRLATAGDACAQAIRDHSLTVWSALAVNLIHAYDPEIVILGGGIMASAAVIQPAVQDYIDRHAHTPWGKVRVVPTQLGDSAALIAGQWLLEEQFPGFAHENTQLR